MRSVMQLWEELFCYSNSVNMYKYIQRDATVSWLLLQELYQDLYMFRAFTMPIIMSNITA
jgi:hypothetical protein